MHTIYLSAWEVDAGGYEFEVSMIYTVTFRPARRQRPADLVY